MLGVEETSHAEAYELLLGAHDLDNAAWANAETYIARAELFLSVCDAQRSHAIVGVVRLTALSDTGYLWMMPVRPLGRAFARASRLLREPVFNQFDVVVGHCDGPRAVRWMRWLGADIADQNSDGFFPFIARKHG